LELFIAHHKQYAAARSAECTLHILRNIKGQFTQTIINCDIAMLCD